MSSGPRTRPATKEQARRYLSKADELLRSGNKANADGDESAAGLLAIHAGISACDAITAQLLGVRSAAQRHHEVLDLLAKAPFAKRDAVVKQLTGLLDE